ncbi:MAG: polysaccharide pyruvyl transferase family protein [Salinivirgaceae bacterium]|nr:polysaccharide pyruvyl transferase family protein [Salinivirgaceae bacterium]
MKIVVVTVYNSHNSGSYLQAYALMRTLEEMGHEVVFMRRNIRGSSHDKRKVAKKFLRSLSRGKCRRAYGQLRQWMIYEKAIKAMRIVDKSTEFYENADCVVLGSDTIWNFNDSYFRRNASVYLGSAFWGKRVVTYAVSAANTPTDVFVKIVGNHGGLENLSAMLVRDEHTRGLVAAVGKEARVVVDPTLLADKSAFAEMTRKVSVGGRFILLYYFGAMTEELIAEVRRYASVYGLKTVSMPARRKWCDHSAESSPKNMVSYFAAASCVITNTFHGTALSMVYEKPFAVRDEGKMKVTELLSAFGESRRLFSESSAIHKILQQENDVVKSGRLSRFRDESRLLLEKALNGDIS